MQRMIVALACICAMHLHFDDLFVEEGAAIVQQALREAGFAGFIGTPHWLLNTTPITGGPGLLPTLLALKESHPGAKANGPRYKQAAA